MYLTYLDLDLHVHVVFPRHVDLVESVCLLFMRLLLLGFAVAEFPVLVSRASQNTRILDFPGIFRISLGSCCSAAEPINLAGGGEKHDLPRRTGRALPPPESAADDRICSARWWSWWRIFALGVCYKLCGICIGSSASNCSGKQVPVRQHYEYCHIWSQHFDDPVHDGGSQHQEE